jgi:hypothetical protein
MSTRGRIPREQEDGAVPNATRVLGPTWVLWQAGQDHAYRVGRSCAWMRVRWQGPIALQCLLSQAALLCMN